jgi:hypothetical protein
MNTFYTQPSSPTHYGSRRVVVTRWCELTPGNAIVLLGLEGKSPDTGMVEATFADESLIWLLQDDCVVRSMFHQPRRLQNTSCCWARMIGQKRKPNKISSDRIQVPSMTAVRMVAGRSRPGRPLGSRRLRQWPPHKSQEFSWQLGY